MTCRKLTPLPKTPINKGTGDLPKTVVTVKRVCPRRKKALEAARKTALLKTGRKFVNV